MPIFEKEHVQLYYLYVSNGKLDQYEKYNLKHLNMLRFDASEKQIYDFRKNQHKDINENIVDLIKDKPINNSKHSNIAFISRDFHERRPSGQLTFKFFKLLKESNPDINIFFYMF